MRPTLDETIPIHDFTPGHQWRGWLGRSVADVLDVSSVAQVWMIDANTTAPHRVNVENILATLAAADVFETPEPYWKQLAERPVWVALVQTSAGAMFAVRIGKTWAQISREGQVGVFRVPQAK